MVWTNSQCVMMPWRWNKISKDRERNRKRSVDFQSSSPFFMNEERCYRELICWLRFCWPWTVSAARWSIRDRCRRSDRRKRKELSLTARRFSGIRTTMSRPKVLFLQLVVSSETPRCTSRTSIVRSPEESRNEVTKSQSASLRRFNGRNASIKPLYKRRKKNVLASITFELCRLLMKRDEQYRCITVFLYHDAFYYNDMSFINLI